jgi:DNA invertase Pin-like site-specific DNA recombinase
MTSTSSNANTGFSAISGQSLTERYLPGEAVGYPRKSTASERAAKSIEDQTEEICDIAKQWGIPLGHEDIWAEAPGHGGDEFWLGGGGTGLEGDSYRQQRHRPTLTRIMEAVIAGRVKAVIVWSQDRLWRDVEICDAIVKFFLRYGVSLYDRNGLVDILTPEGRNSVRNNAIAAAHYREMISQRAPVGIKKSAAKGIVVTDANTLGFRSCGRYSRKITHVPDEQEMVRRIYAMFYYGEDESGPLTIRQIGQRLMSEGYHWTPDLHEKRGKKRNDSTKGLIYEWQVRRVLSDARYIGKQKQYQELWLCPSYLVNETDTVVDETLWHAVQQKLASTKRIGGAGQQLRALTGVIRCGLCFQGLQASHTTTTNKSGEVKRTVYWKTVRTEAWCWCEHKIVNLQETAVDDYIDTVLAPLLISELGERAAKATTDPARTERARLEVELAELERKCRVDLPAFALQALGNPNLASVLNGMEQQLHEQIRVVKAKLADTGKRLAALDTTALAKGLSDIAALPQSERRDVVRAVLRWAVVIPSGKPREAVPGYSPNTRMRPASHAGWLVFLSSWGTYHTAIIEREFRKEITDHRQLILRPARPDEILGTVMDFPDPHGIAAGMKRAYEGRRYDYDITDALPGYCANGIAQIAEFNVDFDVSALSGTSHAEKLSSETDFILATAT